MNAVPPTPRAFTSRIILMRHGETEWSLTGRHTSVTDLPLTEIGRQQARNAGRMLAGRVFGLVLSSPRERAKRTAELAGYGRDVVLEPNLAEWDYGAYEGLTSPQIVQQLGTGWNLWRDGVPGGVTPGEHRDDIRRRSLAVIERALPVLNRGEDVLLVAHGHLLRGLAAAWLGLSAAEGAVFSLSTGTVSELGFEHERQVIFNWNCVPAGEPAH